MRIRGLDRSILTHAETSEERLQTTTGYGFSYNFNLGGHLLYEMDYEDAQTAIVTAVPIR